MIVATLEPGTEGGVLISEMDVLISGVVVYKSRVFGTAKCVPLIIEVSSVEEGLLVCPTRTTIVGESLLFGDRQHPSLVHTVVVMVCLSLVSFPPLWPCPPISVSCVLSSL